MSNELKVVYGMYDLGEEREQARWSLGYIMDDFADIKKRYVTLGFHLAEFRRYGYYKDFGFFTFEEFCSANIPLDKGSISRCIHVYEEFGMRPADNEMSSTPKMFLDSKYRDYSYSQLVEMLPLDENKRKLVKPDMSVSKIRELKKKCLVPDSLVREFVEDCMIGGSVSCFSKEDVLKIMRSYGKRYSCCYGSALNYDFKPGKVAIGNHDDYYTFTQIIDAYAALPGNKLVATSQPVNQEPEHEELIPLFSCLDGSLAGEEFISTMFEKFIDALRYLSLDFCEFEHKGKQLSFKDMNGDSYKLLYMVSKQKGV